MQKKLETFTTFPRIHFKSSPMLKDDILIYLIQVFRNAIIQQNYAKYKTKRHNDIWYYKQQTSIIQEVPQLQNPAVKEQAPGNQK